MQSDPASEIDLSRQVPPTSGPSRPNRIAERALRAQKRALKPTKPDATPDLDSDVNIRSSALRDLKLAVSHRGPTLDMARLSSTSQVSIPRLYPLFESQAFGCKPSQSVLRHVAVLLIGLQRWPLDFGEC